MGCFYYYAQVILLSQVPSNRNYKYSITTNYNIFTFLNHNRYELVSHCGLGFFVYFVFEAGSHYL